LYKTLTLAALLGFIGTAAPISAQTYSDRYEIKPDHVDFSYKPQNPAATLTPNVAQSSAMTLLKAGNKPAQAEKPATTGPAITDVQDAAARLPSWWHSETIVFAMIALAAVFMRLIMLRQRGPKRSDALFVETLR